MTTQVSHVPTNEDAVNRLERIARLRFQRSIDVGTRFFDSQSDAVARACLAMARRFRHGGRLLVFGTGADATDAQHVSVEFVHPVLVGKRALPAIALTSDGSTLTAGQGREPDDAFGVALEALGRQRDIAMAIASQAPARVVTRAIERAKAVGMLTIALAALSGTNEDIAVADHVFVVPSDDPFVVQEVHETLYHILWELVHVFLDHPASSDLEGVASDA
jgi:D-sedoheptulose 7-phosphate isomerase